MKKSQMILLFILVFLCSILLFFIMKYETTNDSMLHTDQSTLNTDPLYSNFEYKKVTFHEMTNDIAMRTQQNVDTVMDEYLDIFMLENNYSKEKALTTLESKNYAIAHASLPELEHNYQPYGILFYCEIDSLQNDISITKIMSIILDSTNIYDGNLQPAKQFSGNLFIHFQSEHQIYYSIDGNFYQHEAQSQNQVVNLSLDENTTMYYTDDQTSQALAYISESVQLLIK